MKIISRAEWGARAPEERQFRTWSQVVEYAMHYSGASEDQTPRSIQNYHMDVRGWSDIGYNFLVNKRGEIFEGRGFLVVGAHVAGHNTPSIGVCVIGEDKAGRVDVTPAAKLAVLWLLMECNRRRHLALGARAASLRVLGHRDYASASTDCPGNELESWLKAGMPAPAGTTPPASPAPNWTEHIVSNLPTLSQGADHVPAVSRLQALVNVVLRHIARPELKEDGDFGSITERELKIVQRWLHVDDDGVAGPETWGALLAWG